MLLITIFNSRSTAPLLMPVRNLVKLDSIPKYQTIAFGDLPSALLDWAK